MTDLNQEQSPEEIDREAVQMFQELVASNKMLAVLLGVALDSLRLRRSVALSLEQFLRDSELPRPDIIAKLFTSVAMQRAASEQLDEPALLKSLESLVLPFMKIRLGQLQTECDIVAEKEGIAANAERRAAPVPICFPVRPEDTSYELARTDPVLLVGAPELTARLLGLSAATAAKAGYRVAWLTCGDQGLKDTHLVVVPKREWANAADSRRRLAAMFHEICRMLGGEIDLIIVSDVSALAATSDDVTGEAPRLNRANVRLTGAAQIHGAAAMVAVEQLPIGAEELLAPRVTILRPYQGWINGSPAVVLPGTGFASKLEVKEESHECDVSGGDRLDRGTVADGSGAGTGAGGEPGRSGEEAGGRGEEESQSA